MLPTRKKNQKKRKKKRKKLKHNRPRHLRTNYFQDFLDATNSADEPWTMEQDCEHFT